MDESVKSLKCMDIEAWRAFTKQEMIDHLGEIRVRSPKQDGVTRIGSVLAVRQHLSPVDMFCYLKARFGEPNGLQNFLRKDDSDNWIHWDFNLKAGSEDVYVCGTNREIHFMLSERLTDNDWKDLILKIKSDYARVGKQKSVVLNSLEKWVIFPNKFVEIATICSDLHGEIVDSIRKYSPYKFPPVSSKESEHENDEKQRKRLSKHYGSLYRNCLELSLITPILAEAFINMTILILCKKEIRENVRQFEAFIRSEIDAKIFDLAYKCEGFKKRVDPNERSYKNFKRVMDKRNHAIHGNIDPEREKIEIVYFEGKRPLFKEPGDHITKHFESVVRRHDPEGVVKDYEETYEFLGNIASCLELSLQENFWRIMEDRYPGYDLNRKITGVLLPEHVAVGHAQGVRYDDELSVSWTKVAR